jgi:hypothetical protein
VLPRRPDIRPGGIFFLGFASIYLNLAGQALD